MNNHIRSIDFLRGIAALGVVLCHYADVLLPSITPNILSKYLAYGGNGVQIFFVISGFIIPYSMTKSNYNINQFWKNLFRRYIRLAPPAYVAMLFMFIIYFLAIFFLNRPINGLIWPGINLQSILGNFLFCAPFFKTSWFNPVFWSLAIEFQFYILIGLLLPLILNKKYKITLLISLPILLIGHNKPDFLDWFGWFFGHASFFFMGISLFMKKEFLINKIQFSVLSIVVIGFCFYQNSTAQFTFGVLTFLFILLSVEIDYKFTNYFGKISYSLYITHWPLGIVAEFILKKIIPIHDDEIGKIILLIIYTIMSIMFAHIFYKYIELKFLIFSKKLK